MEPYVIVGSLLALILLVLYLRRSRKHRAPAGFFDMITAVQKNKGRDHTQTNTVYSPSPASTLLVPPIA